MGKNTINIVVKVQGPGDADESAFKGGSSGESGSSITSQSSSMVGGFGTSTPSTGTKKTPTTPVSSPTTKTSATTSSGSASLTGGFGASTTSTTKPTTSSRSTTTSKSVGGTTISTDKKTVSTSTSGSTSGTKSVQGTTRTTSSITTPTTSTTTTTPTTSSQLIYSPLNKTLTILLSISFILFVIACITFGFSKCDAVFRVYRNGEVVSYDMDTSYPLIGQINGFVTFLWIASMLVCTIVLAIFKSEKPKISYLFVVNIFVNILMLGNIGGVEAAVRNDINDGGFGEYTHRVASCGLNGAAGFMTFLIVVVMLLNIAGLIVGIIRSVKEA